MANGEPYIVREQPTAYRRIELRLVIPYEWLVDHPNYNEAYDVLEGWLIKLAWDARAEMRAMIYGR